MFSWRFHSFVGQLALFWL